ncbi:NAD(P)/FAD-dependent oxidoreductase [Streptomyces sp. NPDC021212]|uniref:NAD(P)/FAD-dependent oxidoreductase n=1 Tax=Streptomyces sp. NPDC021212 TaxID=3365118 RepID=UPI0037998F7C
MTTRAIVLGAGLAGALTASVLTNFVDETMLLDRDRIPDGPEARKGTPQTLHSHILMSNGARTIDSLVPGAIDRLLAYGAHRTEVPSGLVSCSRQGWTRRMPGNQFMITCGRPLLDWVLRSLVLDDDRITLRGGVDVQGLDGDAGRVTGVQAQDRSSGEALRLEADFVVDATGRGSSANSWLQALGLPAVREKKVDIGLSYATRRFRAPTGAESGFPIVNVLPDPEDERPGQGGVLLPIEDGQWMVTLTGTRGYEPPRDPEGFVEFARKLRHSVIGDFIANAEPIGQIHTTRTTVNRRRYYEELTDWPEGFLVLGDAAAALNPVYGHGMSVTAMSASALRGTLRSDGLAPGTSRAAQIAVAGAVDNAWTLATGQDVFYPNAAGRQPGLAERMLRLYVNRVTKTAADRPRVAAAVSDAFTLSAPLTRLMKPRIVFETLLGPTRPPLTGPPLTSRDREFLVRLPQ